MHKNIDSGGYGIPLAPKQTNFGRVSRDLASVKAIRLFSVAVLGFAVGVTGLSRAEAGSAFLGTAGNYNVYVSGNMTQNGGDAATSVAVGGNLTSTQFTIAGISGDSLVVGGNLGYTGAEIQQGNARVAGTVTMGSSDNAALASGATLYYGSSTGNTFPQYPDFTKTYASNGGISPTFFSGANSTLTSDSSVLAGQSPNGTVSLQYGTLTLAGTNPNTDYFNVKGSDLSSANTLNISAPAGATVIVNVDGTSDSFTNAGMNITGTTESKVLFNFYQASSLTLSGVSFEGSILAPGATLTGSGGHTDGNVMVAGISATNYSFEYHDTGLFTGDPLIASVPEPSTLVLAGFGLIGMGIMMKRRGLLSTKSR